MPNDGPQAAIARSPQGLFAFIDANPERTRAMVEAGVLPWWTPADLRAVFLRPVSEWTHRLDYWLWPERPVLMHMHSLLWAAALVVVAGTLYRRVMGAGLAAGLATVLYAVDDARGFTVGWLSNRNALVATTFGLLAVLAHDRWRRDGWRAGAVLGPALLGVGLFSAEAAIASTAWLFAHALFLDRAPRTKALATLLPYAAVVGAWRALYDHLEYGAFGSGLYIDPGREPLRFAGALAARAPLLLSAQWGPVPSDVGILLPGAWNTLLAGLSAVFLALLAAALLPRLRRDPVSGFLATGMVLSVVPICATLPADRLLTFTGVGAMGLVARALVAVPAELRGIAGVPGPVPSLARPVAVFLVAVHGVLAPLVLPLRAYSPAWMASLVDPCVEGVRRDESLARQDLVVVGGLDFCSAYVQVRGTVGGQPNPAHLFTLASALAELQVGRVDERTLRVRREDGWFAVTLEQLARDPAAPWRPGDRVDLPVAEAEVREVTADGRPREVWFRFRVPLEDPSLRWMTIRGMSLVDFVPPRPGAPDLRVAGMFSPAGAADEAGRLAPAPPPAYPSRPAPAGPVAGEGEP